MVKERVKEDRLVKEVVRSGLKKILYRGRNHKVLRNISVSGARDVAHHHYLSNVL